MIYKHDKNILTKIIEDTHELFTSFDPNSELFTGDKLTDTRAKEIYKKIKKQVYLIAPNPVNNRVVFLVYEINDKESLFTEYNQTRAVQRELQRQYDKIQYNFQRFIDYNFFMQHLDFYKEIELSSRNILLNDGYIYDFEEMKFKLEVYDIPTNISKLEFKELKDNDKEILDTCFDVMYDNKRSKLQYLYYILCNLNKYYATQSIFLVIDVSGVGKTSKILCTVDIGLNNILDSGLLKKSELYNIAYKNNVIYNETQAENINGSTLSQIADNAPLTVTVKSENSLTIPKEDKPLIQLMGEALPYLKSFNNGTNRRFLLVPKVSERYLEFKDNPKNEYLLNNFYDILNNKPIQVIQYYKEKIDQYNIINIKDDIKESMKVSLNDLELLAESKENIFSKYFELIPIGKYEDSETDRYLIESKTSLNNFLEYIDDKLITISHFNDTNLRRKYLRKLIKDNVGANVKELGCHNLKNKNYFYYYCLTAEGVNLLNKINEEGIYEEKLTYIIK